MTSAPQTLNSAPPQIDIEKVGNLVEGLYHLAVKSIVPLTSERDQNFLLGTAGGRKWVLKLANPREAPLVTAFQTAALRYLEMNDPSLPVPRVLLAKSGSAVTDFTLPDGRLSSLRLLSWSDGQPLVHAPRSTQQRQSLARS